MLGLAADAGSEPLGLSVDGAPTTPAKSTWVETIANSPSPRKTNDINFLEELGLEPSAGPGSVVMPVMPMLSELKDAGMESTVQKDPSQAHGKL